MQVEMEEVKLITVPLIEEQKKTDLNTDQDQETCCSRWALVLKFELFLILLIIDFLLTSWLPETPTFHRITPKGWGWGSFSISTLMLYSLTLMEMNLLFFISKRQFQLYWWVLLTLYHIWYMIGIGTLIWLLGYNDPGFALALNFAFRIYLGLGMFFWGLIKGHLIVRSTQ